MLARDISFPTSYENILFDEILLEQAEAGQCEDTLRFWEGSKPFIVLGRLSKEHDDLHLERIVKDRIEVVRRASGGGTVVQGPGCLNYSLILSKVNHMKLNDIRQSYQYIFDHMVKALGTLGIQAQYLGTSDLALAKSQKKFSGNAQKRGRHSILHHGTLLYDFDLSLVERYLKFPLDVPDYRNKRNHLEFVTNLNVTRTQLKEAVMGAFKVVFQQNKISADELKRLKQLSKEKYILSDVLALIQERKQ